MGDIEDKAKQFVLWMQQQQEEEDQEEEWWSDLGKKIDSILKKTEFQAHRLDSFASSLQLYTQQLVAFNNKIDGILDPPRAVCDACSIWVSMNHRDHGPTYIQDLGWSVVGKALYCPNCTRIRNEARTD